ncbi:endonuclease/exonuclease/phosphatase family protein [Ramlibacter tataouinensis]|uniref:endonuclease/exonuclease/phosphatase family protein n=1 Tax=Ramlibacter tataouinensis TaxID=94132 RepID=UPI0022F3AC55|nr:endonuclease/exonuclease/phosphatase family protein [Ramlibacter tataouinensis]WBY01974.1 endonuclease/exonuclease/phosphatase family protein [Ramlibacter tataouinensis]
MDLVTWNTQWCCGIDGVVSPPRIVEAARRLADFDVLCLQEIAGNYPQLAGGAGHDQPALLRELLPGFQLFFGAAVDESGPQGERRRFGNLVATRLPVAQVQHHPLPYPADPGVRSMPRMCTVVTVLDPKLGPVRIMTTHLEFYSKRQRMAQARALRELHVQYSAHAAGPPEPADDGSPFQTKRHTADAILCGDFNFEAHEPEYAAVSEPFPQGRLWDSWRLLHGGEPHPPTFRLYDRRYGPDPVACDFVFVSDGLKDRVRSMAVDGATQASDHQPVRVRLE